MYFHSNRKEKTVTSVSYSIYSRPGMTVAKYGESVRAQWGIENSLHWVLNIAFREDESQIRAGNTAENMNMARHIGNISIFPLSEYKSNEFIYV